MYEENNPRERRGAPRALKPRVSRLPPSLSPPFHLKTFQFPHFVIKVKKERLKKKTERKKNPEAGLANEGLPGIMWFNPQNNPAITSPL